MLNEIASLLTLTVLEVVLGVDNLVFISIATSALPKHQQPWARRFGLFLAMFSRLLLLFFVAHLAKLTEPVLFVHGQSFSWRDLIFLGGGLFLLYKGTQAMHEMMTPQEASETAPRKVAKKFSWVVLQIMIIDIVFSLDSVIAAVGMTQNFTIMAIAIVIAVIIMAVGSEWVHTFIEENPTIKMLALSFILLIGFVLVADAFHTPISKGYLYFAIAFSLFTETMNILRAKRVASPPKKKSAPRVKRPRS